MVRICCTGLLLFWVEVIQAQTFKDIFVDPADNGTVLSDFVLQQERVHSVDFICDMEAMRAYTIMGVTERVRFPDYLRRNLGNFTVFRFSEEIVFIINQDLTNGFSLGRENFLLLNERVGPLNGEVLDAVSGDALIAAKIYLPETKLILASDSEGKFNLGKIGNDDLLVIDVQYIGYDENRIFVGFSPLSTQQRFTVELVPESRQLQGVTITADRVDENITSKITGVETLSINTLKTLPAFMGEIDPIRSLTTLPGVSTPGELASGFNVRGGEAGQNLVMQDGAIIYNPSHLFGFFSAFNPDLVSNITLYKGAGPANFGSRISSVVDVSLRNGDATKHTVSGGLGLISSRLTVEGPIVRNKSSYLLGGRLSHANWLVRASDNISLRSSAASFRDITGKIFHTLNENNYLTLSGYNSYDDFKLATDSVFSWGTSNLSLKWDHTFNEISFGALAITSSNYFSSVHSINPIEGFEYNNSIRNTGLKYDFTYVRSEASKLVFGLELQRTLLEPGKLTPDAGVANIIQEDMQDQRSVESALYFQWDYDFSEKWSLAAGLRYGYFARLGKENIYVYDYDEMEGRYPSVSDTIHYNNGDLIKRYSGFEPRISLRYLIDESTSVKASYVRGFQYQHLISNTASTTPQDYWVSSGHYIKPQRGDQYSLGVFRNLDDNRFELSVEGFYKRIENTVDYIEGADITLNPILEAGLSQGEGLAYGVEVLLKKSAGRLSGWVAYTYSRSLRRFEEEGRNTMINNGEYYAATFDQPHNGTLILNYQLGGRTWASANFNYSTGRPITIPVSKFSYDAYLSVLNYSERNDYRIPDYHRLDLSLTIKDKPRSNKRFHGEWVISIFNVYSRKNTYSISFTRYGAASKLSVLGSIFPSINYNFRF